MKYSKAELKNHLLSGINKPYAVKPEVLLKTIDLLRSSHFFIEIVSLKWIKTIAVKEFQVLDRLTYLLTRLSDVTMLFLGLINKNKAFFLIPKSLAISHSNSYLIAHLIL